MKGKGLGKQQEGSGLLDCIKPYPHSQAVRRTRPESQIGRVKYGTGKDSKVTLGLMRFKTIVG